MYLPIYISEADILFNASLKNRFEMYFFGCHPDCGNAAADKPFEKHGIIAK